MAFDPFRGFKTAASIAGSTTDPYAEDRKFQRQMELEKYKSELKSKNVGPDVQARADLYTARKSALEKAMAGAGAGKEIGEEHPEDYVQEPTIKSMMGIPIQMNETKLKKPMQEGPMSLIRSGRDTHSAMQRNMGMITPTIEKQMGWQHPSAWGGAIGNSVVNLRSALGDGNAKDFAAFKSQSDIAFSKFRKFVTGVQAAYPEIQMLTPVYPQPTDTPEVYTAKAEKLLEQAQQIEQMILDSESQRGYRTGELRAGSIAQQNPLQQAAQGQSSGKGIKTRSGMGYTIEV